MNIPDSVQTAPRASIRTAKCPCGAEYVQRNFYGEWTPLTCRGCRASERRALDEAAGYVPPTSPDVARESRLKALPVPPEFAQATVDNLREYGSADDRKLQRKAVALARGFLRQWATDPKDCTPIIAMRGGTGTAKTHLAWAIARELVAKHGAKVLVVELGEMVLSLRESWRDKSGESERAVRDRYRNLDLLVIDEASSHAMYGIENVKQHLYSVVNYRAIWCRPTILTTNESETDFRTLVLGEALASRLTGCNGLWELGDGTDFRVWRAQQRQRKDLE